MYRKKYSHSQPNITSKQIQRIFAFERQKNHSLNDVRGLIALKEHKLAKKFKLIFKSILLDDSCKGIKCILSFLNMCSQRKIASVQHIPSIQNLISQTQSKVQNSMQSGDLSISQESNRITPKMYSKNDADFLVSYFCTVQKLMNKVPQRVSKKQTSIMLKGLWNIVMKYWKERGTQIKLYSGVHTQIEWSLLDFMNFQFKTSMKQRFQAQYTLLNYNYQQQNLMKLQKQGDIDEQQMQGPVSFNQI